MASEYIEYLKFRIMVLERQADSLLSGKEFQKLRDRYETLLCQKNTEIKKLKKELAKAHAETVTVRKYWNEIFDDMDKETRRSISIARMETRRMEQRALNAERQRDEALDKARDERHLRYEAEAKAAELEEQNLRLWAMINRDHENSSKPSSDRPLHKKITNSREKTGRKPGGQPGHKGHKRKHPAPTATVFLDAPDEIKNSPDYYETGAKKHKLLIDIKMVVSITDYYAKEYRRRSNGARYYAPFPLPVINEVNYGNGIKAAAFCLNNCCHVPIRKTSSFLQEITEGTVCLSAGMINSLGEEFSKKTETERQEIFLKLLSSPVMYSDATVGRVNGNGKAVIITTNGEESLFFFRDHKGHEGIKDTPVEDYKGTLVHDHDKTYYSYGTQHQECLAHVLRYLKSSIENEGDRKWNKEMYTFIRKMIHETKEAGREISEDECQSYEREYDRILNLAEEEYEYEPPSKYFREGYNLQKRLREYKEAHLLFLRHPEVDYTNNVSERGCRKYKRKQIQAVTYRSQKSAENFCNSLGVIETAKAKGKSTYQTVKEIFAR